ncbi:MAG TPA: Ig-like domain-containing protein [Pseudolabrys sp.]|nr:Ig-like domain-containing protein [Pseudolabrys sp.]
MTVRSGKTCSLIFRSSGPTYRTVILVRPSHGTVSVGDVGRIIYRAHPGYVGADTFVYARRGLDSRNNPIDATIRIAVTVTP